MHLVGRTNLNTTFSIGFAFLSGEAELDYAWSLKEFSKLYVIDALPAVVVSDADASLAAALSHVSPGYRNLLCLWHNQKNVPVKANAHFKDNEQLEAFLQLWSGLVTPAHVTSPKYAETTFLPKFQMFRRCARISVIHGLCTKGSLSQHGRAIAISVIHQHRQQRVLMHH